MDANTPIEDTFDPWIKSGLRDEVLTLVSSAVISPRRRFLKRMLRQKTALVALAVIVTLVLGAILSFWVSPYPPDQQDLNRIFLHPSRSNLLGTDELGRDVLSRLISGGRVSLQAGFQATLIALLIAVPTGLVAGFLGGWLDRLMMLFNDAMMTLPALIFAIALIGVIGPGLTKTMFAVGFVFAPRLVRLVRGSVLGVREDTFIEASFSIGSGTFRILWRHVLPNIFSPLIIASSLMAGRAMLAEASLSFIGLGVQSPQASWGSMMSRAFRNAGEAPLLVVYPGIFIAATVLALNVLGDGIRDSIGREVR